MQIEALPLTPALPLRARRRWRKPAIGVLVVLLAAALWALTQSRSRPAPGEPDKAPARVQVYELGQGDLATIEARELALRLPLSGSLAPLTQATVKSQVAGVVLASSVQEGMNVAAGQVIAQLDAADQRARVAQQQAALDEASARLALAQKNNANSQVLLKQNYISQSSYDATRNNVELAQATVDAARAQREIARIALAHATIRAPFAGVVSKRYVQAGDKVAPDTPVLGIVDLRQLTLEAQVPASDIPRVKAGQAVRFRVDGYGQRQFNGKVARINPITEAGSRAMLVYVHVDNPDGALRGGMFAKGDITTERSAPHPLVPVAALRTEGARDVVYVVDGGQVVAQPVTLGIRNEDEGLAEVTSGLAAGATVIAARLDGVKPGTRVRLPASAPAATSGAAALVVGWARPAKAPRAHANASTAHTPAWAQGAHPTIPPRGHGVLGAVSAPAARKG
jgi:membrane fusion protein (multidrug efflux system)